MSGADWISGQADGGEDQPHEGALDDRDFEVLAAVTDLEVVAT